MPRQMPLGDAAALPSSGGLLGVLHNGLKVLTHWYAEGRWDAARVIGSGGMPSSHTACVVALTTALGSIQGTESGTFAIGLVFSLVVMYDASGVRSHAGKQASVLNILISELPPDHPGSDTRPLRERLGHTPIQVAFGALLGVIIGYMLGITWLELNLPSG